MNVKIPSRLNVFQRLLSSEKQEFSPLERERHREEAIHIRASHIARQETMTRVSETPFR